MPKLDVSSLLLDPMLADRFTVNRRAQVLVKGRAEIQDTPTPNVVGVVTSAGPNDLERLDDQQRMGRHLVIVTRHRLQGPTPGKQPDTVTDIPRIEGTFVVLTVDPYPQYGRGFVQAIVGSMDVIDQPLGGSNG